MRRNLRCQSMGAEQKFRYDIEFIIQITSNKILFENSELPLAPHKSLARVPIPGTSRTFQYWQHFISVTKVRYTNIISELDSSLWLFNSNIFLQPLCRRIMFGGRKKNLHSSVIGRKKKIRYVENLHLREIIYTCIFIEVSSRRSIGPLLCHPWGFQDSNIVKSTCEKKFKFQHIEYVLPTIIISYRLAGIGEEKRKGFDPRAEDPRIKEGYLVRVARRRGVLAGVIQFRRVEYWIMLRLYCWLISQDC